MEIDKLIKNTYVEIQEVLENKVRGLNTTQ